MKVLKTLTESFLLKKEEFNSGITFIENSKEEIFLSYGELYSKALNELFYLQSHGFKNGNEVVFQIQNNYDFIITFWTCILGGFIPVPLSIGNNDEQKMKLFKIWKILNNGKLIITKDNLEKLEQFVSEQHLENEFEEIRKNVVFLEKNRNEFNKEGIIYKPDEQNIAFIQFSSGSTGTPKGVVLTHKNLITNIKDILKCGGFSIKDSMISWMPLTHDMGMIGFHLVPFYKNINQYIIPTTLFIRRPTLWLEKVNEHRISVLSSPNFGYKYYLKHFNPENTQFDLSCVRLIFNGAEPISSSLCNQFLDTMSGYGLKRTAMFTVYGLAEASLAVSFPPLNEEFKTITLDRKYLGISDSIKEKIKGELSINLVDEGYPLDSCRVRISDKKNHDLGEDIIGYIHISGNNVTSGYYNNNEATKELITDDGWLNTGDLGFIHNKRLIVTGRAKDIIFISGQNYYSHDIEKVIEEVNGIELGKVVATGIFKEELQCDELVVFVYFKQKIEEFIPLIYEIKKTVSEKIGIEAAEVLPITKIPKTTSGKIQRYFLRESYLNGEFQSIINEIKKILNHEVILEYENDIQKKLHQLCSQIKDGKNINLNTNFFELGFDSIGITQIISRIRDEFKIELTYDMVFNNPTVIQLSKAIDDLKKEKNNKINKIKLSSTDEKNRLSSGQHRLWFLNKLYSNTPQYNLFHSFIIEGEIKQNILEKSFNKIIERHEILRTSYIEEDGQPLQVINKNCSYKLEIFDFKDTINEDDIKKYIIEESKKPFDLNKDLLFRSILIILNERKHILLLIAHHIVFDGWSFGILLNELSFFYINLISDIDLKLSELPVQYADYANWQAGRINDNDMGKQIDFWKKKLSGNLEILNLPFDKQRPSIQTFNSARHINVIPYDIIKELISLAVKNESTLFMVLVSVFKILLYRYTGQEDIIIGTAVANRNVHEIEGLIGFFTNNIVLKTTISDLDDFQSVLKQVKTMSLESFSNQEVPFEKLVDELNPVRDMSRNPLFQVLIVLQNTPLKINNFSGFSLKSMEIDNGLSQYDLTLELWESDEGLKAVFTYNTDLFYKESIEKISNHFHELLKNIIADPSAKISKLQMLPFFEKEILFNDWNNTGIYFEKKDLITAQLFEEQVKKFPANIAVVCNNESLTYYDLNIRANKMANFLISHGVKNESIIGVYIDRSLDMIISLLAIHKTGAAYLPLDPIFPTERISYMIQNARVNIILTQENLLKTLPVNDSLLINLDSSNNEISKESINLPEIKYSQNHLAYLIYTSGSTGNPKGVMIEHHSLTNFLLSFSKNTDFTDKDSLLAVTTLSFDISCLELFLPLINGGKVVLATREQTFNAHELIKLLDVYNISMMQATPATWKLLLEAEWKGKKDLTVLCGGEALPKYLSDNLIDRVKTFWNVYGPTETTIWSTMAKIEDKNLPITIGKPIANTDIYILDSNMQPVPVGVPGELYIGGDGVARGYLGYPQLTKEKFLKNPFKKDKNKKIYKTGDLVKYNYKGNIEFIGRIDNQVKIRGFRIELGEIETILNSHPDIKESVVAAKEIYSGDKSLVAYIIPKDSLREQQLSVEKIKKFLKVKLPDYMMPSSFILLESFPFTANGKIDRKSLPMPDDKRIQVESNYIPPSDDIEKKIIDIWKEVLKLEKIGIYDNFFDLGGHSLLLAQVQSKLSRLLEHEISILDFFRYPTVHSISEYIKQIATNNNENVIQVVSKEKSHDDEELNNDIAVIGMSCRLPGAVNIQKFWNNLINGVESISIFTDDEIISEGVDPDLLKKSNYVKAWGTLDDIEKFDASFFGYSPREAEILDPQQRIFLEESWKSLEDAGYDPNNYKGLIGIFAGVGMNTYLENLRNVNLQNQLAGDYQIMISNDKDFLSTRVAYKLNLKGPALTVQTACSSSLVAVHLACSSIKNGECDIALAGGVSIRLPQKAGYLYQEGMILSSDGHCRAFDEKATGTIGGNGAGVIVLKKLDDAIRDKDDIYAVIKGSAINNDGALKIGYTAPSIEGQMKVIYDTLKNAKVNPETITYIETHGTGTNLGDPIEIEALSNIFKRKTDKKQYCAIGSVKTNIGHLDSASGIVGIIKTILSIRHKMIPPSLHFKKQNPKIIFENSPFYVNTNLTEWKTDIGINRAGISSFGIGGTNAHVILEGYQQSKTANPIITDHLIVLSAKTETALDKMTQNLKNYLKETKNTEIDDVSFTLQTGRKEFQYRRMFICKSREDAIEILEKQDPLKIITSHIDNEKNKKVVFMFPGQGSQFVNMSKGLFHVLPVFRESLDKCNDFLKSKYGFDVLNIIFTDNEFDESEKKIKQTKITQPALFFIEYAMAQIWLRSGIQPYAMIGHSIGEYVSACLAGVLSLEDALTLVYERSKLISQLPTGSMIAVGISENEAVKLLNNNLSLATVNAQNLSVISGTDDEVDKLEHILKDKGNFFQRLRVSHAFHSIMMEPILIQFLNLVKKIKLNPPAIPYISNLTGTWIKQNEATDPSYWVRHLRETVRFSDGISELKKDGNKIFLEVGPGTTLSNLVRQQINNNDNNSTLSSIKNFKNNQSDYEYFLNTAGQLWLKGININLNEVIRCESCKKVHLPAYPFDSKTYWIERKKNMEMEKEKQQKKYKNVSDFFYTPVWKEKIEINFSDIKISEYKNKALLIILNDNYFNKKLLASIKGYFQNIIIAFHDKEYKNNTSNNYFINTGKIEDFNNLFNKLSQQNQIPEIIINLMGLTEGKYPLSIHNVNDYEHNLFYSSLYLAQVLGQLKEKKQFKYFIISNNMNSIFNESIIYPEKAVLIGAVKVINQEYPNIKCKSIDIDIPNSKDFDENELIKKIIDELYSDSIYNLMAFRGSKKWIQDFEKIKIESKSKNEKSVIRKDGIYLITGGLGGIGLELAEYLAEKSNGKIILLTHNSFPDKNEWNNLIKENSDDKLLSKIEKLKKIESLGATVIIYQVDVSNYEELKSVKYKIEQQYGQINGIIHAAGIPGGGMIQMKNKEFIEHVFKPKINGLLSLYEVFKNNKTDFFVLCSSLNAITGGFGQSDYSAANSFMDYFAQSHNHHNESNIISINWDRWPGIGMAGDINQGNVKTQKLKINHPLLKECILNTDNQMIFYSNFDPEKDWVLNEHIIMDHPTIAGTTYLEMVRACLMEINQEDYINFKDIIFLSPMVVKLGEKRSVFTIIDKQKDYFSFEIISRIDSDTFFNNEWIIHVRGKIYRTDKKQLALFDINEIKKRCNQTIFNGYSLAEKSTQSSFISFGKRWNVLKKFDLGNNEGAIELELSDNFIKDLEFYKLHPALLDVATGSIRLISSKNYLPFSYEEIKFNSFLPKKIFGHIKYKNNHNETNDIITCDVDIFNHKGDHLIEIKNFSMKEIDLISASNISSIAPRHNLKKDFIFLEKYLSGNSSNNSDLKGLTVQEGIESFDRIIESNGLSRIIVSVMDINEAIENANYIEQLNAAESRQTKNQEKYHTRPDLKNDYVQPKNESEKKIVELWQELFSIDKVGIQDDFFELGGDSLLLIQSHTKLKEMFNTNIAVVDLYKYKNISLLSKYLTGDNKDEKDDLDEIKKRTNIQIEKMNLRKKQILSRRKHNE